MIACFRQRRIIIIILQEEKAFFKHFTEKKSRLKLSDYLFVAVVEKWCFVFHNRQITFCNVNNEGTLVLRRIDVDVVVVVNVVELF